MTLKSCDVAVPVQSGASPLSSLLPARIEFLRKRAAPDPLWTPPPSSMPSKGLGTPSASAVLPVTVTFLRVTVPLLLMPPPSTAASFPVIVLLTMSNWQFEQ